jgi:hypothetical protein
MKEYILICLLFLLLSFIPRKFARSCLLSDREKTRRHEAANADNKGIKKKGTETQRHKAAVAAHKGDTKSFFKGQAEVKNVGNTKVRSC